MDKLKLWATVEVYPFISLNVG